MTELMSSVTVVSWSKTEGREVEAGEPICQVETEKAISDVESPASGILRKIVAQEGTRVFPGDVLALIGSAEEELPEIGPPAASTSGYAEEGVKISEPVKDKIRAKISPLAKRLAKQYSLDISTVTGTGPGGKIIERDIIAASKMVKKATPTTIMPLTDIRRVTAEKMIESYAKPQVTITMEVDASGIVDLRRKILKEVGLGGAKVSFTDMIVKVCAEALRRHPLMNSTWTDEGIRLLDEINIGIAVASDEGLRVPVIKNADKKSLNDIASQAMELIERTRQGNITLGEVSGGTFTVTNLGMFNVETFTPIMNPPEVAILGVGRINRKPVVLNEQIVKRDMICLSLSFDHRVVDGATAAKFLQTVREMIEDMRPT
jgi:pyruvate dehydrogenase E2 component (dihydrolipoamide acetyltransferase)